MGVVEMNTIALNISHTALPNHETGTEGKQGEWWIVGKVQRWGVTGLQLNYAEEYHGTVVPNKT